MIVPLNMGSTHPLELKAYQDLEWFDFPFIERPDMAVLTLPKAFHNPMSPHIRGLSAFNREGFSVFDAALTGELTGVIKALERGTHFLLNQGTHFPAVIRLEISKDQTPVWELSPYISGSARALLSHQIYNADIPKVSASIRQEADTTETQSKPQQKQKPQIERHMIQLEVEGENGRPLPERKNVTIVVQNTSQDTVPVEQRRNVIYDPETRIFKTKPGEAFKVYAITERMVEVQKDLNDNHNLSQSEANGLIRPLEITGSDKRHDDVIIHYAKYLIKPTLLTSDYALQQISRIANLLAEPAFVAYLTPIFGQDIHGSSYRSLYQELKEGSLEPPQIIVITDRIEGHLAAFNNKDKCIYVCEEIVEEAADGKEGADQKLITILVEEFGHFIDDRLRNHYQHKVGGDAQSDEGAIFAYQIAYHGLLDEDQHTYAAAELDGKSVSLHLDMAESRTAFLQYANEYDQQDDAKSGEWEFFGAGLGDTNNDKSHGHRSIERILLKADFESIDLPKIYFGNWLRDFSQCVDPALVRPSNKALEAAKKRKASNAILQKSHYENGFSLSRESITKMVGILATQEFKKDDAEYALGFKELLWSDQGQDILGVYRPEEHIDNPMPGSLDQSSEWEDNSLLDAAFAKPPSLKQLEVNPTTLLKNYIATDLGEDQNFQPATAYMAKKLKAAMSAGHTDEGLRYFGEALHVLEDFFSHSNFIELALIELGYDQVYPWVDESEKIKDYYPLVTGAFGSTDMAHSIGPKLHQMIPHEIKPYDSPDLKNIAPEGEEPKWRCADDYLILILLEDIDASENHIVKQEMDGRNPENGYRALYIEYLKYRDLLKNGKDDYRVRWAFQAKHYSIQFVLVAMNFTSYQLLGPISHSIDDAQTLRQDAKGSSIGSNPSHSQLAKDHDTHFFHDIAAQLASTAVLEVGKLMRQSMDGKQVDRSPVDMALSYICHPKDTNWYKAKLKGWANSNPINLKRAESRHEVEHFMDHTLPEAKKSVDSAIEKVMNWPIWSIGKKLKELEDE